MVYTPMKRISIHSMDEWWLKAKGISAMKMSGGMMCEHLESVRSLRSSRPNSLLRTRTSLRTPASRAQRISMPMPRAMTPITAA